jgi:predicted DNA-binding antitoxin AbrB/MazE fold protein
MPSIEAVYQGGVFKPLERVDLRENQKVRLDVRPVEANEAARAWLEGAREVQQRIIAERGYFPDSAADIAADRGRND